MAFILVVSLVTAVHVSAKDPLNSNIPNIFSRFRQLDTQMGELRRKVEDLESGALEAEKVAQTTSASVARSAKRATAAATAVRRDAQTAGSLGAAFLGTGKKVRAAATQMGNLRQELHALEASVVRLGMYSSGLGSRIGTLQDDARELVPGMGGLGARIDKAEATIKKLQEQVSYPEVHGMILTDLRNRFRRQQERVQWLAAEDAGGIQADDAGGINLAAGSAAAGAEDDDIDEDDNVNDRAENAAGENSQEADAGGTRDDSLDEDDADA